MNLDFPQTRQCVAYAATIEGHWDLGRASYLKLKSHCEKRFHPIEIFSEKIYPEEPDRPIWNELVERIGNNEITLIIVPTLFHIAGRDIAQLADFLALLERHNVKLITLKERVDSDMLSRSQILFRFVNETLSFNPTKGHS